MAQVADPAHAQPGSAAVTTGAVAYCVTDDRHFLGAVALVNSLRLSGWSDEIVIVDCGMDERARALIGREATILPAPGQTPPYMLKMVGPLVRPAEVMLIIDADVIVTRALDPLVATAAETRRLVGVVDRLADRFDERWGDLLELGPLRRQPYMNSGFLIVPAHMGERLLVEWERVQRLVDLERSMIGSGRPTDPFFFPDQDALNALVSSTQFRPDEVLALPHATAPHPPFNGLSLVDVTRLRVVGANGSEPFALHHIQRKPWLHPLAPNVYSDLLPRLWLADDVPVRLDPEQVPIRFRPGVVGRIGDAGATLRVATEQVRRTVRTVRTGATSDEIGAAETLWQRLDEFAAAAPLVTDLVTHRLQCFEIRQRRRLGLPVPDELAKEELGAIAASMSAETLLADARRAYDGPMLLMKGYEVGLRYPEPWLRPFSDIDLLVDDSRKAQAALLAAGFLEVGEPSIFEDIHHLRPLWRPGSPLVIELHHELKWPEANPPPSTRALLELGVPSRSGVPGLLTLPDGLHALALAAHSWAHVPLRRLLDLADIAILSGHLDRQELDRLAAEYRLERIWRTTIATIDDLLRGGRRPTLAGLTWARHLSRARDRTVFESHLERWLSPFWAYPPRLALAQAGPRFLDEVRPGLHENWRDKRRRTASAARDAFVRRSEHDRRLGPAANRRRRR